MAKKKEIEVEVTGLEEDNSRPVKPAEESTEAPAGSKEDRAPAASEGAETEQLAGEQAVEPEPTVEEQLRSRIDDLEDRLLRTAAEFDNYKKRIARQFEDMARTSEERLLRELLEIVDNFDRALHHVDDAAAVGALRQGVEFTYGQMSDLLAKYNVTPIEAVGAPFDPNLHEAVMQVDSADHPEGVVAVEITRGYMIGTRVLRHSKVAVSRGSGTDHGQKSEEENTPEANGPGRTENN